MCSAFYLMMVMVADMFHTRTGGHGGWDVGRGDRSIHL